jgi:hypothetical protein
MSSSVLTRGHAFELRPVEWLDPEQATLGEHFEIWLDQLGAIQAADGDEHHAG